MKIALPTDDRKTLAKRTGRAVEFVIYTLEENSVKSKDYVKNTHSHHDHEHGHGHGKGHGHHDHKKGEGHHNHDEIKTILNDVDVLIVGRVGKFMKKALEDFGIDYQLTKQTEIDAALEEFLAGIK